jgi:hypothetical protein
MDLLAAPPRLSTSGVVLVGTGWGGSSAEAGLRRQGVRGRGSSAAPAMAAWGHGSDMAGRWGMAAAAAASQQEQESAAAGLTSPRS